jgi:hypothetical protein
MREMPDYGGGSGGVHHDGGRRETYGFHERGLRHVGIAVFAFLEANVFTFLLWLVERLEPATRGGICSYSPDVRWSQWESGTF